MATAGNKSLPILQNPAWQALGLWGVFYILAVVCNGTIPFILGVDLHAWTASPAKSVLFHIVFYAGLFLVAPLVLVKGWPTVRRPAFLIPLLVAVVAIVLRPWARASVALVIPVLAYLHIRFDLSGLGFRSRGLWGDVAAIALLALLNLVPALLSRGAQWQAPGPALLAGLDRLFANPASTTENLFYFGFLAERLSSLAGRGRTPVLIGLMYTLHEMTNPEYWYRGMSFGFVFVGVTIMAALYLWRRNLVAVWLGDGLGKVAAALLR